ncbi:MAG: hypothetical protein R3F42_08370 [Pseudomonadota bacterium]
MKFQKLLSLATALLCSPGLYAELIPLQKSIEASDISIKMTNGGNGYVLARECDSCPYQRLDIDSKTVIRINGKPVRPTKAIEKQWPGGTVTFDLNTTHAAKISLQVVDQPQN